MSDAPPREAERGDDPSAEPAPRFMLSAIRVDNDFPLHHEIVVDDGRGWGLELAGFAIGVVLFAVCLALNVPRALREHDPQAIGWIAAALLLLIDVIARRVLRKPRSVTRAVLPVLAFALVALPVTSAWQEGRGGYFAIAGIVPWSDASNYFQGAVEVGQKAKLDYWNERRPVNAAINSLKLRVGGSVKGWSVVNAILFAVGLALAAREIALRLGSAAGAVFIGSVCAFGASYSITTTSEVNGLFVGVLATAVVFAAIRLQSVVWVSFATFLVALSLDVRPGAVFTLPLLWAWTAFAFGDSVARRLRIALVATLVTIAAMVPSRVYAASWGEGRGAAQSNFSSVLFGLAAGNTGWQSVFVEFPELADMDESRQSAAVYALAFRLIREDPGRFAAALGWNMLFFLWNLGVFVSHSAVLALLVLALCFVRWRDPVSTILLCVFAGACVSAGFVIRDGGPRVFASTVPLMAVAVAYGVGFVEVMLMAATAKRPPALLRVPLSPERPDRIIPMTAAGLTFVLLAAPIAIAGRAPAPALPPPPAASATNVAFLALRSGVWVDVFPDDALAHPRVPDVRVRSFVQDVAMTELADLDIPQPPFSFGVAVDGYGRIQQRTTMRWFMTRGGMHVPRGPEPLLLAGDVSVTRSGFRYIEVHTAFGLTADGKAWRPLALTRAIPSDTAARSTSPK